MKRASTSAVFCLAIIAMTPNVSVSALPRLSGVAINASADPGGSVDGWGVRASTKTLRNMRIGDLADGSEIVTSSAKREGGGRSGRPLELEVRAVACIHESIHASCSGGRGACDVMDGAQANSFYAPQVAQVRPAGGGGQWQTISVPTCDPNQQVAVPEGVEPPEQPAVPTLAQLQEAFVGLPFAKPEVSIQPVGNKTLINLPTFYRASWPDRGLSPGDVSRPVKLLSWSVEFRVASKDYRYHFGDGHTSGWVSSEGGVYPDGDVKHTYTKTQMAEVKVDARVVGQMRVNGGAWENLPGLADIQDEPITTLEVAQAKNRLVAPR